MVKKFLYIGAVCVGAFVAFSSFDDAQTDEQRIASALQGKIDAFMEEQTAACDQRAMEAAVVKVDSIVAAKIAALPVPPKQKKALAAKAKATKTTPKGNSNTKPAPAPAPVQAPVQEAPKSMKEKMEQAKNDKSGQASSMKEKMEQAKQEDAQKSATGGTGAPKTMKEKMLEEAARKKAAAGGGN